MKKTSVVFTGILLMVIHLNAFSQPLPRAGADVIEPYQLNITYFKTTNLIFPYAIKSVDRGSKDVLAQKPMGIENILQIKAGRKGFEETNLTVITEGGKLYSFVLNYSDSPAVLNLQLKEKPRSSGIIFSQGSFNEAEFKVASKKIALAKRTVFGKKDKSYGVKLQLEGLYVKEGVMFYQISLVNWTNLDYDLDQFRFFVRDRKKTKRTASQEREIIPLFVNNKPSTVKGRSDQVFVFALPKFTIPDQKYFAVQVMEKNGGRHLELKIGNPTIMKSKTITP